MWLRDRRNSLSRMLRRFDSGIITAGRSSARMLHGAPSAKHLSRSLASRMPRISSVLAVDRKARMAGFDHAAEDFRQRRVGRQHTICARGTITSATRQVGDLDRAFDHRQGVVRTAGRCLRVAQLFEQFVAVARLAGNQLADAFQPGSVPAGD